MSAVTALPSIGRAICFLAFEFVEQVGDSIGEWSIGELGEMRTKKLA